MYVPDVRLSVGGDVRVIVKPPSLKTLLDVTSPMVNVLTVAPTDRLTPAVLLLLSVMKVDAEPPMVCAEVPLQLTVPVVPAEN